MKRIVSLIVSAVMLFAMTATTFADPKLPSGYDPQSRPCSGMVVTYEALSVRCAVLRHFGSCRMAGLFIPVSAALCGADFWGLHAAAGGGPRFFPLRYLPERVYAKFLLCCCTLQGGARAAISVSILFQKEVGTSRYDAHRLWWAKLQYHRPFIADISPPPLEICAQAQWINA